MPHPLTLPTLAVLAVTGSVGGVYLGRSAIAEINPAYYDEPEPRFHADLVPNPPGFEAAAVRDAAYLGPAETHAALGTGCVNCLTYPEEYYPVHDSSVDKYQPGYAGMIETAELQPAAYVVDERIEEERAADVVLIQLHAGVPAAAQEAADIETVQEVELAAADAGGQD